MAPRSERVQEFCPWCGQPLRRVMVHGEVRCAACHMPVDVCCEGAPLREHEVPACPIPDAAAQTGHVPGRGAGAAEQPADGDAERAGGRARRPADAVRPEGAAEPIRDDAGAAGADSTGHAEGRRGRGRS